MLTEDQVSSLIADTYKQASLANCDMKNAAESLEKIRYSMLKDDEFKAWEQIDDQIGRADIHILQSILIIFRNRFEELLYSSFVDKLDKKFKHDAEAAWIEWLQLYAHALSLLRIRLCDILSKEKFPFPSSVKDKAENIRSYTTRILKYQYVESRELF